MQYDKSLFYIDFSDRDNLTNDEKKSLEEIQNVYRPIERVELIIDFLANDKITTDDFEKLTGLPYSYGL